MRELGVAANLAESFANLYFRNCVNYALPALAAPGILANVTEGDRLRVDFAAGRIANLSTDIELEADPLPEPLLDIVKSGGVLESLETRGFLPAQQPGGRA